MTDDTLGTLVLLAAVTLLAYAVSGYASGEASAADGGGADAGTDGADGGDETAPVFQSESSGGSAGGSSAGGGAGGSSSGGSSGSLPASTIASMAQDTLGQMNITDIAPTMVATIAMIESAGNPGAVRQEPRIGDASYGLMQTLLGTATWLASIGYSAYGTPTAAQLLQPQVSLYFGTAYLHWLRNWKGTVRADAWVVAAYNGGPGGAAGAGPQAYLAKYLSTASQLGYG